MSATTLQRGTRRLRPRGTLVLFLGVGAVALVAAFAGKLQGELLIGVAFALVIVGDLVGAYRAFGTPAVALDIAGDGEIGTDLSATVIVHGNRQPLWIRFGWWDPRWFTLVAGVPGWNRLRPGARGTIGWIDVDLVGRGPLGLWQVGRRDRLHLVRPVPVGPPPIGHELAFPPLPVRPFGESQLTLGADDLTRGVRDYRPGDARKLVHWSASAHHGRLLVRETETLGITRIRIGVLTPLAGAASEVALGRAAFLVRECLHRGWEVELLTTERSIALEEPELGRSAFGADPTCSLVQDSRINSGVSWFYPWPGAPMASAPRQPTTTRRGDVRSIGELTARLAVVAAGPLELPSDRITTRIVSGGGDEWR